MADVKNKQKIKVKNMNENLNLVQIFKDCPICPFGTKLYSLVHGDVYLHCIDEDSLCPIILRCGNGNDLVSYSNSGKCIPGCQGECVLFPSKDQRDWDKFSLNHPKFDHSTLKPFDKVLVRDSKAAEWSCDIFSHIKQEDPFPYVCIGSEWKCCIPCNDETKHLVGTTDAAPEFYRYCED